MAARAIFFLEYKRLCKSCPNAMITVACILTLGRLLSTFYQLFSGDLYPRYSRKQGRISSKTEISPPVVTTSPVQQGSTAMTHRSWVCWKVRWKPQWIVLPCDDCDVRCARFPRKAQEAKPSERWEDSTSHTSAAMRFPVSSPK